MPTRLNRLALAVLLVLATPLLAGCVAVVSEHPLSTAADSVVDERLIGWWDPVVPTDDDREIDRHALVVGRSKHDANGLEFVLVTLDERDTIDVEHVPLSATRIGDQDYLSARLDENVIRLYRYAFDEAGRVTLHELGADEVADAIERGDVAGEVTRAAEGSPHAGSLELVRLSAPTDALRAWIAVAGDSVWQPRPFGGALRPLSRTLHAGK